MPTTSRRGGRLLGCGSVPRVIFCFFSCASPTPTLCLLFTVPLVRGASVPSPWQPAPFLQVSEKLKLAEKTALDIDRLRDGYRPAARRGAILFFVLSEMALVTTMYQYSLSAFLDVFGLSLKKSLPDSILMKRLKNIMDTLTFNIYNYGCTGERPLWPGQLCRACRRPGSSS